MISPNLSASNGATPSPANASLEAPAPALALPPRVFKQPYRPAQSNIPDDRAMRERIKVIASKHIEDVGLVPPLSMEDLRSHAVAVRDKAGLDPKFDDYIAVLVNNEAWRDTMAQIPFERRLLLVPKCLRVEEHCPAPFDEFGMLCKECGLCTIQDLTVEAERLGYAVLIAEGSAIVTKMIEAGSIEAVVGVSCLNVLEKCFPHMEAAAIPGMSIPLLQDDCINTTVDMDWVWDVIHLTSADRSYRLDLDAHKKEVQSYFEPESLDHLMGPASGETEEIAREWLARSGKRWRPYLTSCAATALRPELLEEDADETLTIDLKKVCVAVECFHKASLIHDDIEDGDDIRYGEDTVHKEHGIPIALNVGDFLIGEGYRLLTEISLDPATKVEMLRIASVGHVTLSRGQGAELCWSKSPQPLSSLQVLDIFRQKTAPAFEVALRLGSLFGGGGEDVQIAMQNYSESLGIAYQIRDDLEDYSGEGDSCDLQDMRPSVIMSIAHRRAQAGEERELIESLWRQETAFQDVETKVRALLSERGVVEKANELREAYEQQAIRSLSELKSPTLKGLLRRVLGKIFGMPTHFEGYCGEFEARNAAGRPAGAERAS